MKGLEVRIPTAAGGAIKSPLPGPGSVKWRTGTRLVSSGIAPMLIGVEVRGDEVVDLREARVLHS